jgi:hypothetical protein
MKSLNFGIIIIALLCASCGTKRVVTTSDVELRDNSVTNVKQTHESREADVTTATVVTDESMTVTVETVTVVYDTGLPVLPETGKPPVLSETTTRQVSVKGVQVNETVVAERVSEQANVFVDSSKRDVQVREAIKKEEKRGGCYWWWLAAAAGAVCLSVVAYKVVKKRLL